MAAETFTEITSADIDHQLLPIEDLNLPTHKYTHDVLVRNEKACRYTYEVPQNEIDIVDPTPILIVPGYGGIKPAYRRMREAIVQNGRPAVTIRPIRDLGVLSALNISDVMHPEKLPGQTTQTIIDDIKQRYNVDQLDIAGHSMGGFVSAETAKRRPECIRSICLIASAGIEDHRLSTFVPRIPKFIQHEFVPHIDTLRQKDEVKMALEALHYIFRNPLRTLAEGVAVANCNIRDDLRRLQEDEGIQVSIILFEEDQLIKYAPNIEHARFITKSLFTHPDSKANHMWPQLQPESIGRLVVEATANHQQD